MKKDPNSRGESSLLTRGNKMKKVLLTSTALVMTAGVAAAEMTMSASAKLTYGNFGTGNYRAGYVQPLNGTTAGGAAAAEDKDDFTIMLVSAGDKKINVIKEVRAATSLGLKEAKDLVEGAPKEVKAGVPKKEAEEIKAKLEAAGAKVELK